MQLGWMGRPRESIKPNPRAPYIYDIRRSRSVAYDEWSRAEYPYRMISSLYIFLLVGGGGLFLYQYTMRTPRSPFPILSSNHTDLTLRISLSSSSPSLSPLLLKMRSSIFFFLSNSTLPPSIHINWQVDIADYRPLRALMEDKSSSASLHFFIAFVPDSEWEDYSATSVLLTRGKWALVQVKKNEDESKLRSRVGQLLMETLIGVPHLEIIDRRHRRERLVPWQVAALSPDHQKRLVWNSRALASEYSLRLIDVHPSEPSTFHCSPPSSSSYSLLPSLREFARRLQKITKVKVKNEHVYDVDLTSFVENDVQGRQTMSKENLHLLIKLMDSHMGPTLSFHPQLRIIVLHSLFPITFLDEEGEDSANGIAVAGWGGVVFLNDRVTVNSIGLLRVVMGMDGELPSGWRRVPCPMSEWELSRMELRALVDFTLDTRDSIFSLRRMLAEIDNLEFTDGLASRVSSAVSSLSSAYSSSSNPSLALVRKARGYAESALFDKSLLSLLYFPTEQRLSILLPLVCLYLSPALSLLPRLIHFALYRSP